MPISQFKIQVVKQVHEEGKKATKVGKELELSPNMVARWVKEYNQYGEAAFSGSGGHSNCLIWLPLLNRIG